MFVCRERVGRINTTTRLFVPAGADGHDVRAGPVAGLRQQRQERHAGSGRPPVCRRGIQRRCQERRQLSSLRNYFSTLELCEKKTILPLNKLLVESNFS